MITCKFFQQGNCRYGQYCRFSHAYNVNFGATSTPPNKSTYTGTKNTAHPALAVAEEVLAVERGGQWLLSCFGPFKERPCIPGMVDLSPEEYHWEMYQAQRSGTIDQVKLQFQQLCEDMKAKQALLKNPTREIVTILETLQKGGSQIKSEFGTNNSLEKSSNFSFTTPQMTLPNTSTSASNLFASNPFRSNTTMFGTAGSSPSIFGGATSSTTNSLFGAKPTFGSGSIFGGTSNATSTFGGTITSSTSSFPGQTQNTSSFNATMPQSGSVFNTQPAFGQCGTFNGSTQANTPFGRLPISSTTNPIYSGTATSTNVLSPYGAAPAQISSSIFGGTQSTTTSMFGGGTQQANSMFSGSATSTNSTLGSTSLFAQPKTTTAFGGGPVFGGAPSFGAQANTGIFGAQSAFGNTLTPSTTIFGGQNTTPLFGSVGQPSNPSFGSVVKSPISTFGNTHSTTPFGSVISTTNPTPFGSTASTANSPFISSTGPFTSTTAVVTPFSTPSFGSMVQNTTTDTVFGTNQTPSTAPFDAIPSTPNTFGSQPNASPFGQVLSFGNVSNSSPFANTNTTITTTVVNPFASQSQKTISPFSVTATNQGTIFSTTHSTPFGNSPFASTNEMSIIDETAYSTDALLTDDEKAMYLDKQFTLGKIPLRPPTQELR